MLPQCYPAALALALKDAATRHHGAASVALLRAIVDDRDKLADIITDGVRQFVAETYRRTRRGRFCAWRNASAWWRWPASLLLTTA